MLAVYTTPISSAMEQVIDDQTEFVRTLCTKCCNKSGKQWASLSMLERMNVVEAVKRDVKVHIARLTDEMAATPWIARFADYLDSLLVELDASPKLVVVKLPAKKPAYVVEQQPGKKRIRKRFHDAHSDAREIIKRLAELLYFKAVRQYGHTDVEYIDNTFFSRACRRGNDVYGNPRNTRPKIRVVYAMRNLGLSSRLYAAGPDVWHEADLTVVFARTSPSKKCVSANNVQFHRIICTASGNYKIRMHSMTKAKRKTVADVATTTTITDPQ